MVIWLGYALYALDKISRNYNVCSNPTHSCLNKHLICIFPINLICPILNSITLTRFATLHYVLSLNVYIFDGELNGNTKNLGQTCFRFLCAVVSELNFIRYTG